MSSQIDQAVLQAVGSRWLAALTEGSREVVSLLEADGSVRNVAASREIVDLLGIEPAELQRADGHELVHPDDRAAVEAALKSVVAYENGRVTTEYRVRHRLGHYVRVQTTFSNRLDDSVVGAIVAHMRRIPNSDTPVASRPEGELSDKQVFLEHVERAVEAARTNPDSGFTLITLELDRMKMLIGSYGQDVVDELLLQVARRLAGLLRPGDTLARLGGGEFAILLDGVKDRRSAARVADRIQRTLGRRFKLDAHLINVHALVGIATSERTYDNADQVMRDAALALNRARGRGRKRRAVFQTQMRVEDTRFMAMVTELHNAVADNQLRLHYQPIISLASRTLTGFEALVRWEHPTLGLVSPGHFIPVAEETGAIVGIGHWVLKEACRQMAEWNQKYQEGLDVSVNLSAKQFADEQLLERVERVVAKSGLEPSQLKLELTESTVLDNQEAATRVLEQLKERGVRISLDDFGTGYSSFSYLHQLPYDTLKIDRSFVSRIGEQGENCEIVHAIIVLAHNLRMDVVAEGVEEAHQATQLQKLACEYGQGYHFAKPLDATAAGALIESQPDW